MLLIASQSPFIKPLPTTPTNSDLLLTQDGVIAITQQLDFSVFNNVYALSTDVMARGLIINNDKIEMIDITQFVKLTENHQPIVNW